MNTITAVCASPPLPNPGMASVDLALYFFLRRNNLLKDANFVYFYSPLERNPELTADKLKQFNSWHNLPFEYTSFRDKLDEVYNSKLILYWGDFLHSRDYLYSVFQIYKQISPSCTNEEVLKSIYKHFYLNGAPDNVFKKCILFGGTLLFNKERDYGDEQYSKNLYQLLRQSRNVWFRDVYSALKFKKVCTNRKSYGLGVDAALLLRKEDTNQLITTISEKVDSTKKAGIFFGRSSGVCKEVGLFVQSLCKKHQVEGEWFPWFPPFVLPNFMSKMKEIFPELILDLSNNKLTLGDLFKIISGYELIITDTYHVCLTAWRLGIPAICIGETTSEEIMDISCGWKFAWRDKRQVFYAMNDAMEYFVFKEELMNDNLRNERIDYLVEMLGDISYASKIASNICNYSRTIESQLLDEVSQVLSKTLTFA